MVLVVQLRRDVEGEVDAEEELNLEGVHLSRGHSSNLGVVSIVEVLVIEELGGEHNTSDGNAMDIQLRKEEVVALNEAINVDQGENEALGAARCVLVDALKVAQDRDAGRLQRMEARDDPRVELRDLGVGRHEALKHIREHLDDCLALRNLLRCTFHSGRLL